MEQSYNDEIKLAKDLAQKAGAKILEIYNSDDFGVEQKEGDDNYISPLTKADTEANKIIVEELRNKFPQYAILTEEEVDDKVRLENDYCWIIDPLDGTKEFVKKNGEFTVNIALVKNGKPVLGVVYAPVLEELYWASEDGSYLNGEKISVSSKTEELILVKSRSHPSEKLAKVIEKLNPKEEIPKGSSLKGCLVATGKADVYIRLGLINEWDICAMDAVVKFAGGVLVAPDGNERIYNQEKSLIETGFIVCNNKVKDKILEMIK